MHIVLLVDYPNLGKRDAIVDVRPGYARNFLIPQGIATFLTTEIYNEIQQRRARTVQKRTAIAASATQIHAKIKDLVLTFERKALKSGKLYGSVTEEDIIAEILRQTGVELITESLVHFTAPIKQIGESSVRVTLSDEIETKVQLIVVAA